MPPLHWSSFITFSKFSRMMGKLKDSDCGKSHRKVQALKDFDYRWNPLPVLHSSPWVQVVTEKQAKVTTAWEVWEAEPCWRGMLHHSMCQPCCQGSPGKHSSVSRSWKLQSLRACSQCPRGVWARNARVQSVGVKQGKESPAFPSTRLKGSCSKTNQTIIFN